MTVFSIYALSIATIISSIVLSIAGIPSNAMAASIGSIRQQAAVADTFDFPISNASLIPNAGYAAKNPALTRESGCYPGKKIADLYHAGEDWKASAGTPVKAVANGEVVYADPKFDYRAGNVVIIKHTLPDSTVIYSMYGHLTDLKVSIDGKNEKPNIVKKGDEIGKLIYQSYVDNNNKQLDNSHLHFEIRTFADGSFLCGKKEGIFPAGPGYTDKHPDTKGYKNPSQFIWEHQSVSSPGSGVKEARLVVSPNIPVIKPGEKATLVFTVQNTGSTDWPARGDITLVHVSGKTLGIQSPHPLVQTIPVGREALWEFSVTAPEQPGVYDGVWRMANRGEPFGDSIRLAIVVVPKESGADFVRLIQMMIAEAQNQIGEQFNAIWEDLKRRVEQRIEEEIRKEAERRLRGICGVVPASLVAAGFVWRQRRRR
ncbi:MAG: peptidoglycan DD-metalloendopeptidase family protein [Roseiflexaceae bacterium]|nr:peptidoglycan DD-metalloendopeptidase family protein [Roseiflexaceae bacterium]